LNAPFNTNAILNHCTSVAGVAISPHVARLRAAVGHELLVLPSASLLITDDSGRILLCRPTGHSDGWHDIGGAIDPGESPAQAAVREAHEELGVKVRLGRLLGAFSGPDYEVTYPNGDIVAYVTICYEAFIVSGDPVPDGEELSELRWFSRSELREAPLSRFARALLTETGYLPSPAPSPSEGHR
jgi:8-oxo-dGTP pyrophosphatase MutT (NUDIX family)